MRMLQVSNLSSLLLTRLGCDAYPLPSPRVYVSGTLYEWNYILGISHVLTHRCIIKLVRQYSSF